MKAGQDVMPKQRSLHSGVVIGDSFFVFGGYDGSSRLNELHRFDFPSSAWSHVIPSGGSAPSPRDRLAACALQQSMYIFGGYDGTNRVNDLWRFDVSRNAWSCIDSPSALPSPRHSHSLCAHNDKLYLLFGYDGNYKSDVWEFNPVRKTWVAIAARGPVPKPRYRSAVVAHNDCLYVFGGHDGSKHLDDLLSLNLKTFTWTLVEPNLPTAAVGPYRAVTPLATAPPLPRDSHSAVLYGDSIFVFGGSSGAARNDLYEYRIDLNVWIELQASESRQPVSDESPRTVHSTDGTIAARFCHVAAVHKDCMYVHAGYDGQNRLADLKSFSFVENVLLDVPPPTILEDIALFVNQTEFSDISILVGEETFYGHKIILSRCPYFKAMFTSNMREQTSATIADVAPDVFSVVLSYLYTDQLPATTSVDLIALFTAADRFGVERLKKMCEQAILATISIESSCAIFHSADLVSAATLRKRAAEYIVRNYEAVVKTAGFEDLARRNIELTLELIRLHS